MKAEKRTFQLPYFHIGKRILKSAAAVFLSLIIGMLRGGTGIPFYSAIAAILCIQPYMETSWKSAKNRLTGTFIGALYGTPVLLLNRYIIPSEGYWQIFQYAFISLAVILVIYTACIIKIPSISYFSCVVFLSIVVNHIGDAEPLIFVRDRILDTVIGVLIALFLNSLQIPRKKRKDILFVFELDEKTLDLHENLNSYSKIMMNRMISEGACFTIATPRTPASSVDIIREIYWMYIWSIPLKEICWKTKDESKYFFSENEWTEEKIQEILNNEIYAGYKFIEMEWYNINRVDKHPKI